MQVSALLTQIQRRYGSSDDFRRALIDSGLTETVLRAQLAWQLAVLDFTETRFGTGPDDDSSAENDALFRWLDIARKNQRISIRAERLK